MAEHGHGHESADRHGKHNEWIGKKTKEALAVGGLSMLVAKGLFTAACVFPPFWMFGAIGLMTAGAYAFAARNKAGGASHKKGGGGH